MQPEYVGILLNDSKYRGIPNSNTGTESLQLYEEASKMFRLVPCFFRIQDISLNSCTVDGYVWTPSGYVITTLPIPHVIHNRAIHHDPSAQQVISSLLSAGIFVFNANTRYGKDIVHLMLLKDPLMQPTLPHSLPAKSTTIKSMLRQHGDLVLKPCSGSIGKGIMRLRRGKSHDYFTYSKSSPSANGWRTARISKGKLPTLLLKRISSKPFLAQQRIPLAEYDGRPYDIRVTVQRGLYGNWEISGMFARTSPARTFVSNIAQGGSVYNVQKLFSHSFPGIPPERLVERTTNFAIQTATSLTRHMPYSADFGIDVAVTQKGELFFIEANGCDQRYGFREAGMDLAWKETYRKPMAFARYLLNTGTWPSH